MEKESTDKSIYQISTQTNTPDKVYDEEINISEALNLMELDRLYKSNLYQSHIEEGCSSQKGFISQEVYGCHTCNKKNSENQQNLIISGNGKKMLGFCLYCVETEHKDHEVFEVGLRKHFRCDSFQPTLEEAKTPVGQVDGAPEQNVYNHNFEGLFCHCNQPYEEQQDMLQCSQCEDFLHLDCMKLDIELRDHVLNTDFTEHAKMLCRNCLEGKYKFLLFYPECHIFTVQQAKEYSEMIQTANSEQQANSMLSLTDQERLTRFEDLFESLFYKSVKSFKVSANDRIQVQNHGTDVSEEQTLGKREHSHNRYVCDLLERKQKFGVEKIDLQIKKAVIIKNHFNSVICACDECMDTYRKLDRQEKFIFDSGEELEDAKQQAALKKAQEDLKNLEASNKVPETFQEIYEDLKQGVEQTLGMKLDYQRELAFSEAMCNIRSGLEHLFCSSNGKVITIQDVQDLILTMKKQYDERKQLYRGSEF